MEPFEREVPTTAMDRGENRQSNFLSPSFDNEQLLAFLLLFFAERLDFFGKPSKLLRLKIIPMHKKNKIGSSKFNFNINYYCLGFVDSFLGSVVVVVFVVFDPEDVIYML